MYVLSFLVYFQKYSQLFKNIKEKEKRLEYLTIPMNITNILSRVPRNTIG